MVKKCQYNQNVKVSKDISLKNALFGNCQNCHCKQGVTLTCVTVSGEVCILIFNVKITITAKNSFGICDHTEFKYAMVVNICDLNADGCLLSQLYGFEIFK